MIFFPKRKGKQLSTVNHLLNNRLISENQIRQVVFFSLSQPTGSTVERNNILEEQKNTQQTDTQLCTLCTKKTIHLFKCSPAQVHKKGALLGIENRMEVDCYICCTYWPFHKQLCHKQYTVIQYSLKYNLQWTLLILKCTLLSINIIKVIMTVKWRNKTKNTACCMECGKKMHCCWGSSKYICNSKRISKFTTSSSIWIHDSHK